MILIFPGEDQFLSDMLQLSPVGLGSGLSHLFSGVGGLPTSSSYCHILVGRTDGHRERLVQVDLICGTVMSMSMSATMQFPRVQLP